MSMIHNDHYMDDFGPGICVRCTAIPRSAHYLTCPTLRLPPGWRLRRQDEPVARVAPVVPIEAAAAFRDGVEAAMETLEQERAVAAQR